MNSFVNDGSFLERFKQNAKPSQNKSTPSKESLRLNDDVPGTNVGDIDPKTKETVESLARSVAILGKHFEESEKERHSSNPAYWFLKDKNSQAYKYYTNLIEEHRKSLECINNERCESFECKQEEPAESFDNQKPISNTADKHHNIDASSEEPDAKRKRKSRWGKEVVSPAQVTVVPPAIVPLVTPVLPPPSVFVETPKKPVELSAVQWTEVAPGCSGFFTSTGGSFTHANFSAVPNISSSDIASTSSSTSVDSCQLAAKALAKAAQVKGGQPNAADYDSDEDTEGGTWEHKKRLQEMEKTKEIATKLTEQSTGKHFIGDFLPPEEFQKFYDALNKTKSSASSSSDKSDYQENKLLEDNMGFKLLQKMGWTAGKGLGANEQGITAPVNKGRSPNDMQGLGTTSSTTATEEDDLFDVYRKRMMLAYRFRPNPLNNPRRPYY